MQQVVGWSDLSGGRLVKVHVPIAAGEAAFTSEVVRRQWLQQEGKE